MKAVRREIEGTDVAAAPVVSEGGRSPSTLSLGLPGMTPNPSTIGAVAGPRQALECGAQAGDRVAPAWRGVRGASVAGAWRADLQVVARQRLGQVYADYLMLAIVRLAVDLCIVEQRIASGSTGQIDSISRYAASR